MNDDELYDLLMICRENNAKIGVTGMLLYRDGFFIQALEGERETVEALLEKISQDPRHTKVLVVHRAEINAEERTFGAWSMGFNKVKLDEARQIAGFTEFLQNPDGNELFTQHPERAQRLLQSFRDRTYF